MGDPVYSSLLHLIVFYTTYKHSVSVPVLIPGYTLFSLLNFGLCILIYFPVFTIFKIKVCLFRLDTKDLIAGLPAPNVEVCLS